MSQSVNDILSNRNYDKPDEIEIIKKFVHENFDSECSVRVSATNIMIQVDNSALAGSLRLKLESLKKLCDSDKKLFIRIV